jgi:hypothetical protein
VAERNEKRGLQDIKLLAPETVTVDNIVLAAFSNGQECSMVCFYPSRVTYWTKHWTFNRAKKLWDVAYDEQVWSNPPAEKPKFQDRTADFIEVLHGIKQLAEKLEFPSWAEWFQNALTCLKRDQIEPGVLPHSNQRLLNAASAASVFGGMGSWNDSPQYAAYHEKGLRAEFDSLSSRLYREIMLACMYAVNEW